MPERIKAGSEEPEVVELSQDCGNRVVMERMGKIEDMDRSFDIEFWQRQGSAAIFSAAWKLVRLYHARLGENVDELPFQRSVESFQRMPD
jgi:hypothetical protein